MNSEHYCIGVMSGTSLDGIDLIYVKFEPTNNYQFKILHTKAVTYHSRWKYKLQHAIQLPNEELTQLDIDYGILLGEEIRSFIKENRIEKIDFIASHGHTIFHQPDKGITLQIGNGQKIADITQQKVICDFRTQDVALGGQGAPLVPIGDEILFSDYQYCINLGGFANISFKDTSTRIAFDICPVNIVLNHYCRFIDLDYDDGGKIASSGHFHKELFDKLNKLAFYHKTAPKSLGLEWVTSEIFPIIDGFEISTEDILRTFVEHSAYQISNVIKDKQSVLITGGGAYNSFLIERLQSYTNAKITIPNNEIIEYKEALIFALLGLLKLEEKPNCLKSVTGASKNHSSGVLFNPNIEEYIR